MIKVIIFDFDGIIVESVDIKTRAFAALFSSEGEEVALSVVKYHLKNTGISRFDKFRYIYKNILRRPLSEEEFERLCICFSRLVMDEVVRAPFVPGAEEFLRKHSSDYGCFLITATPQEEIDEILARRGSQAYFKAVYGAPKKKQDSVKAIIGSSRVEPKQVVYVGDSLADYAAAKENNVNFIARSKVEDSLFKGCECLKVPDLTGLLEALKRF
jgi:HAD superfamily hydrolase (TIGR01549 family)